MKVTAIIPTMNLSNHSNNELQQSFQQRTSAIGFLQWRFFYSTQERFFVEILYSYMVL
ncbi:MAG: hypothetical protein RR234_09780 [Christensenella sp.]